MHISKHEHVTGGSSCTKGSMDPLGCREHCSAGAQEVQGIDTASNCSETTILYDVNLDMIIDYDIVECESVNTNINDLDDLPDINQ